jgi:putative glutathione S-transferase
MDDLKSFRDVGYFEKTFSHQIAKDGEIKPQPCLFTKRFGGGEGENPVESGRYRLIWMPGCPHAHKVVITRKLLGLEDAISLGTTGIYRTEKGWAFTEDPEGLDPILKIHYLHDIYTRENPEYAGRSTVPIIVDAKTGKGANNDHFWLSVYLSTDWKAFHKKDAPNLYPEPLREEIDRLNRFILERINEGVYSCGFARSQQALEEACWMFFNALDMLEGLLSKRRFLFGDYITDADIRVYPSLVRFFVTYYQVFRVNRKRLEDYPSLWAYARDLYQTEGFYDTTCFDLIKRHYQLSPHLRPLWGNKYGIVAKGPDTSIWNLAHGREDLSKDRENKFCHYGTGWLAVG